MIARALTSRRPRPHYTVDKNSRRMTLISHLPLPVADAVRRRIFGMPAPDSLRALAADLAEPEGLAGPDRLAS